MKKRIKMLSDRELSDFCDQLTMILQSGISLTEGLDMMREDAQSAAETQVLRLLMDGLSQTGSFCDALKQARVYPDYMIQMVRLGEQTGHLDDVMAALAEHYDRSDSVRQSLRSAVFYPAVMSAMMILIVGVLLTKVMPIFNQVFLQLGTELSGVSRVLLNLGSGIRRYALILLILLGVLAGIGICIWKIPRVRACFLRLFSGSSPVRRLCDNLFLFRFASGMALALSSGMDSESALDMVGRLTDDPQALGKLEHCRKLVSEGQDFSQSLNTCKIFSGTYSRMAAIGQKTGTMEQVMRKIAQASQEEFSQKITRLLGAIEPTMVVILSVIVGIILMSVMFPLLGILSGM